MAEYISAQHWNYFKTLCDDVEKLGRFIELTPANNGTYSIEIVRLFFAACSEIDVVLKLLCSKIEPKTKVRNIDDYCRVVTTKYPRFTTTPLEASAIGLEMLPWANWEPKKSPPWWRAYNDVKHERNAFFKEANVGNLLQSMGGLCLVLCYYQQVALNEPRRVWPSEFVELKVDPLMRLFERQGLGSGEPKLFESRFPNAI